MLTKGEDQGRETIMFSWRSVILVIVIGLFTSWYLDTPLPDDMQEKWKVRIIDAGMRTYGHLVNIALYIFIIFSSLHGILHLYIMITLADVAEKEIQE